jgi:hypothetical protein
MQRTLRSVLTAYPKLPERNTELKAQIYGEIHRELEIHARLEGEILYPALEAMDPERIARAREEHAVVGRILGELAELLPGEGPFDFRMHLLREVVERHALMEEEEIFPLLDDLDLDRQQAIWEDFRARKIQLRADPVRR